MVTQATAVAHAAINSPLNPIAGLSQVVHALNSAASSVAPAFQSTIIDKLPGPLQTVWSDLSSPAAFTLGFTQGALDGAMSVFDQMADSIPALASTASSVASCTLFMSCSGLASDLSSAAQAVSTADPAKIIDSAKHFALDPFADIANHAASGDWNGAGVASGHAAVGVVQAALAVSGICEAVMADSCFLPSLADAMGAVDAVDAVDTASSPAYAYHYTTDGAVDPILSDGLNGSVERPGYATPDGSLSPLQAHSDLALNPAGGPRNSVIQIDLNAMSSDGYEIPGISRVTAANGMAGGGWEMQFPYRVLPKYLRNAT